MKIDTKDMPSGFSLGALMTLAAIYDAPGRTTRPTDIADAVGVSRAAVTGTLDRLESDQLIERSLSPDDRRSFQIKLTDKGKRLCRSIDATI